MYAESAESLLWFTEVPWLSRVWEHVIRVEQSVRVAHRDIQR